MNRLQDQMIRSVAVTEGFIETIRGLKGQLAEEKSRVLVLSSMCGHVRTLSTALSTYVKVHHYSDYFYSDFADQLLPLLCAFLTLRTCDTVYHKSVLTTE